MRNLALSLLLFATLILANCGAKCVGYCPQSNGSTCETDCDCDNKCLNGTCADPKVQPVSCTSTTTCPNSGSCSLGACGGAACASNGDCSSKQLCTNNLCVPFGCM